MAYLLDFFCIKRILRRKKKVKTDSLSLSHTHTNLQILRKILVFISSFRKNSPHQQKLHGHEFSGHVEVLFGKVCRAHIEEQLKLRGLREIIPKKKDSLK